MADVVARLMIQTTTPGLSQAQAQINALYKSNIQQISRMTMGIQKFGHHSLAAFQIFKGLAIYRGFGMLTQQLGEGAQAAIEFEKAMANVNSLLQVSNTEIQQWGDYLARVGARLPLTLQTLAEGMYDIVSAGITAEDQIKHVIALAGTAAVAGVTSLKSAVQAGIGTMNAFGKSVEDLEHIYDVHFMTVKMGILTYEQLNEVLGRVSASAALAGQAMETAFAALVAVSRGGFGGVAFAEGSTRVVRFFQELSDPSAQADIERLGVAVYDSFGKMRNAIDIVADLQVKLAAMTDQARQATINQIFTNIRSAQGFQVLSEQLETWRDTQYRSIFAIDAMTDAYSKQADTVAAAMTKAQNAFTSAMRGTIAFLEPALKNLGTVLAALGPIVAALIAKYLALGVASKLATAWEQRHALALSMSAAMHDKLRQETILTNATIEAEAAAYGNATKFKEIDNIRTLLAAKNKEIARLASEGLTASTVGLSAAERKHITSLHAERNAIIAEINGYDEVTLAKYSSYVASKQLIAATKTNIAAFESEIAILKAEAWALQFRKVQLLANVGAMLGMSAGMGLMIIGATQSNDALRIMGAAMTGVTLAFQVFASLLPVFIAASAARQGANIAETATIWGKVHAMWALITAESALTGGTNLPLIAAGIAVALGAMTAVTMALTTATNDAATAQMDFATSMDNTGIAADDLAGKIKDLVKELVLQGESLQTVVDRVKQLTGMTSTFNIPAAISLVEAGYTTVGGKGYMSTQSLAEAAFPEKGKEGYDLFIKAMQQLGYYEADITEMRKGNMALILEVQDKLLGMEDIMIRDAYATMIFGEKMGNSLITLWDDMGKKMVSAGTASGDVMAYANEQMRQMRENAKVTLGDTINASAQMVTLQQDASQGILWPSLQFLEKELQAMNQPYKVTQTYKKQFPWEQDRFIVEMSQATYDALKERQAGELATFEQQGGVIASAMTDTLREHLIEQTARYDENWQVMEGVLTKAADGIVTFTDMVNTLDLTDAQRRLIELTAAAARVTSYAEEWSKIGAITKVDDFLRGFADRGSELDVAGTHFDGVAGKWDDLAVRWEQIQQQWQALDMMNTFISMFTSLGEVPSLADIATESLAKMEPVISQFVEGIVPGIVDVFSGLPLDDPNFWAEAMRADETSDEVVKTVKEGMMEVIDAVTSISKLDDFVEKMIAAGDTLDAAGFYFGDVAGRWDDLGEDWKKIQKMWMALGVIQSIVTIVDSLATAMQQEVETGTRTESYTAYRPETTTTYEEVEQFTAEALAAQKEIQEKGWSDLFERWQKGEDVTKYMPSAIERIILSLFSKAVKTETIKNVTGTTTTQVPYTAYRQVTTTESIFGTNDQQAIADMQRQLWEVLLPVIEDLTGGGAGGLIEILTQILGPMGDPDFWDIVFGDTEEEIIKTVAEMADEWVQMLEGAGGFSSAIDAMVEHSEQLEAAGYYWKGVAGNWAQLGEEWARIQAYFQVTNLINSFVQAADAMREYGVDVPQQFEEYLYELMQTFSTSVLPDFQDIISNLIDQIGTEGFWEALAEGMANADIQQSNSIVLAPYIVISERADAEEVVQIVHDALVDEARRAGFSWQT